MVLQEVLSNVMVIVILRYNGNYYQAQREITMLKNWMKQSHYDDLEPFVLIDDVSGRLRPLYEMSVGVSDTLMSGVNAMASMFNLSLSPEQVRACAGAKELEVRYCLPVAHA
jgi:hypothetical protein